MARRKLTTLESFARWLRKQPADTVYPFPPSECCPLAQYKNDGSGFPGDGNNPRWAIDFMNTFDTRSLSLQSTQAHALEALAIVEANAHSAIPQQFSTEEKLSE